MRGYTFAFLSTCDFLHPQYRRLRGGSFGAKRQALWSSLLTCMFLDVHPRTAIKKGIDLDLDLRKSLK